MHYYKEGVGMLGLVLQRCEEAKSRADSAEDQLRGLKQQLLEAAERAEATTTQVCFTPTAWMHFLA